jgi:putative lipoprotein
MRLNVTVPGRVFARHGASLVIVLLVASTAAAQSVRGTATYLERMALPAGATFEALLEDVSRADAPAEVIGRTQMTPPGNPPIPFEIRYDPTRIQPSRTYHVRARILLGERLIFTTDTAYPVLTRGSADTVSILMRRAAGAPITPPGPTGGPSMTLQQTYWKATELAGRPVVAGTVGREAHLVLSAEGRVTGSDGCNQVAGTYELIGDGLKFSRMIATQMACQNTGNTEPAFHDALNRAARWRIAGDRLELFDEAGALLGRFEAAGRK